MKTTKDERLQLLNQAKDEYSPQIIKDIANVLEDMEESQDKLNKWYDIIVKERDRRLSQSKENGDYNFNVAHGLTEAIRLYDDEIKEI